MGHPHFIKFAIEENLLSYYSLLLQWENADRQKLLACGSASNVKIRVRGEQRFRYFVITASHVICKMLANRKPITLCFPKCPKNIQDVIDVPTEVLHSDRIRLYASPRMRQFVDVAVAEIRDYPAYHSHFLTLRNISLRPNGNEYFFTGIPESSVVRTNESNSQPRVLLAPLTYRAKKGGTRFKKPENSCEANFFLKHATKRLLGTNKKLAKRDAKTPRLRGMSGAGVWRSSRDENGRFCKPRLVGVQISYLRDAYIRCTEIFYALRLIYAHYADLVDPFHFYVRNPKTGLFGVRAVPHLNFESPT